MDKEARSRLAYAYLEPTSLKKDCSLFFQVIRGRYNPFNPPVLRTQKMSELLRMTKLFISLQFGTIIFETLDFWIFFVSEYVGLLRTGSGRIKKKKNRPTTTRISKSHKRDQQRICLNKIVFITGRFKDQKRRKGTSTKSLYVSTATLRGMLYSTGVFAFEVHLLFFEYMDNICSWYFVECAA